MVEQKSNEAQRLACEQMMKEAACILVSNYSGLNIAIDMGFNQKNEQKSNLVTQGIVPIEAIE